MKPFTALNNLSPFHLIFFTYPNKLPLRFTLLFISAAHFPSLFYFLSRSLPLTGFHFPNPRFENMRFTVGSSCRSYR